MTDAKKAENNAFITHLLEQIELHEAEISKLREALSFYASNKGLRINFKTNAFESADSDEKDFHGALARRALGLEKKRDG